MGFRLRLQLPGCRTLKDRRSVVEGIVHGAKSRHGFSASDVSDPLKIDYAEIGFAAVGKNENELRGRFDRVTASAENGGEALILGVEELMVSEEN